MNTNAGGGKKKASPTVSNPYAKKRKAPPPSASAARPPPAAATANRNDSLGGASVSFSTFSQAFESIEDSQHYKNQQRAAAASSSAQERRRQEQWAQQRAFEAQAAAAATTGTTTGSSTTTGGTANSNSASASTSTNNLTDRDHHAWLQPHCLYVSTRQRGNGVLSYIRNVPVQESRMVPDFVMSSTRCALFLSCKYHALYPRYIYKRLGELGTDFTLRVLLVLVDEQQDNANTLLQLNILAVQHNMTMILAWSEQEAARYLETFKAFDGRDASLIQKKEKTHFADQVSDFLTTCKTVNKTDAAQLLTQFQSVRSISAASMDELGVVSGMGEVKVKRLYDALHKPFSSKAAAARRKKALEEAAAVEEQDDDDGQSEGGGDGVDEDTIGDKPDNQHGHKDHYGTEGVRTDDV